MNDDEKHSVSMPRWFIIFVKWFQVQRMNESTKVGFSKNDGCVFYKRLLSGLDGWTDNKCLVMVLW